jgi:hypothetical protein
MLTHWECRALIRKTLSFADKGFVKSLPLKQMVEVMDEGEKGFANMDNWLEFIDVFKAVGVSKTK